MNINMISCECDADMCSSCIFEDCACECHDLCDSVCPLCGEAGVAEGAHCHMVEQAYT
jgi:hypothetical protein